MPLDTFTFDDFKASLSAAGLDTPEKVQLAHKLVGAFINAGVNTPEIAVAFATHSALQMQAVALEAKAANMAAARDARLTADNEAIAAVTQQINAVTAALQSSL